MYKLSKLSDYLKGWLSVKVYRFVARNCYQKKMHGVFRGLNFEKAKIPDGEYEEIMGVINSELPVPNIIMKNTESWFTNKGYSKFENYILKLLELYEKYSPRYIREWNIVETEIQPEQIQYQDEYQVVIKKAA